VVNGKNWAPRCGDILWLDFDPQSGREQRGRRPAFVLSDDSYNRKVGLAVVCPITSKAKGYPFEVALPPDAKVMGVILGDQLRSIDWKARNAEFACRVDHEVLLEVQGRIMALLNLA
jgi:mRNA interferase MazF